MTINALCVFRALCGKLLLNNLMVVIILAAGKGTRMRSKTAKVLHNLNGKPLLRYVIDLAYKMKPNKIFVVIGFQRNEVKNNFISENVEFIDQKEQLGTGHAIMQVKPFLENFEGEILVLSGDVPCLRESTANEIIGSHRSSNAAITILTAEKDNPYGYGRVVRNSSNAIEKIAEENECSSSEKAIKEVNSGIYCFNKKFLLESLEKIDQNNAQHEYYLTDIVKIAFDNSLPVTSVKVSNPNEINGINTIENLVEAEIFLTG